MRTDNTVVTRSGHAQFRQEASVREHPAFRFALFPLALSMPFLYWPVAIETDTQAWTIIGCLIAFIFYWPKNATTAAKKIIPQTGFVLILFFLYYYRDPFPEFAFRYAALLTAFLVLWSVAERGIANRFGTAVRATILIWFAFGLYQTVGIRMGFDVSFAGRFVSTYSGVPSITAEPSFYGSISVLQIMYLMAERRKLNIPFIGVACANLLMSGSLLAFLLIVFPLSRLPNRWKFIGAIAVFVAILIGVNLFDTGFFARVQKFQFASAGSELLLSDISLNLRFGHIWFTFIESFSNQMLLQSSVNFFAEYNRWANINPLIVRTGTDFILPSGGELLFRSGPAGLLLIIYFLVLAWKSQTLRYDRIEKVLFVSACFLNPLSIANPFFIFYIYQRR